MNFYSPPTTLIRETNGSTCSSITLRHCFELRSANCEPPNEPSAGLIAPICDILGKPSNSDIFFFDSRDEFDRDRGNGLWQRFYDTVGASRTISRAINRDSSSSQRERCRTYGSMPGTGDWSPWSWYSSWSLTVNTVHVLEKEKRDDRRANSVRSNDKQASYFGKERGRGQNRRGSGCSTTPGQLGSLETTDCRPVASIDPRNPTVHNTEPRARSCRRAAPRHYAPLRSVPLRAGSPGHISRCTGQDPIARTRVRHLTVPDSRRNVGWITDPGKGQQVQGERVALLVLSPFRCVKRDRMRGSN